jgi:hypothetical protein
MRKLRELERNQEKIKLELEKNIEYFQSQIEKYDLDYKEKEEVLVAISPNLLKLLKSVSGTLLLILVSLLTTTFLNSGCCR